MGRIRAGLVGIAVLTGLLALVPATAGVAAPKKGGDVAAHWTAARMRAAEPRDLRVDARGLGYVAQDDGSVKPHGHQTEQLYARPKASKPAPTAGKPSAGDRTGPTVTAMNPAAGATIGASATFSATITDTSGVGSVTFTVRSPSGALQSFTATPSGANSYSATIGGFTNGSWRWRVVARDASSRANTTTTTYLTFSVNTGSSGGGTVVNSPWTGGGTVQQAAGRIYFEMPTNSQLSSWAGYVCSGTVARDGSTGRSVIITAAHCVYEDVYKAFARNVLFIPNQDATTGTGTDTNCSNDPMGCWIPSFGVVDVNWANRTFPNNIPWDYAYYVVNDTDPLAHRGTAASSNALDQAAGDLEVKLTAPTSGAMTHALGYSYSDDPNFMYCAQGLGTESSYGDWWLSQCDLSGGSSGGPWLQPVSGGAGPIVSVNSWGYTNQPGMGGPKLSGTSAGCVFGTAKTRAFESVTNRGVVVTCP
jgi:hypothetical protein